MQENDHPYWSKKDAKKTEKQKENERKKKKKTHFVKISLLLKDIVKEQLIIDEG